MNRKPIPFSFLAISSLNTSSKLPHTCLYSQRKSNLSVKQSVEQHIFPPRSHTQDGSYEVFSMHILLCDTCAHLLMQDPFRFFHEIVDGGDRGPPVEVRSTSSRNTSRRRDLPTYNFQLTTCKYRKTKVHMDPAIPRGRCSETCASPHLRIFRPG